MWIVLLVVGLGWALLGVGNLIMVAAKPGATEGVVAVAMMFNGLLFVLPGLMLAGIGALVRGRRQPMPMRSNVALPVATATTSPESRTTTGLVLLTLGAIGTVAGGVALLLGAPGSWLIIPGAVMLAIGLLIYTGAQQPTPRPRT